MSKLLIVVASLALVGALSGPRALCAENNAANKQGSDPMAQSASNVASDASNQFAADEGFDGPKKSHKPHKHKHPEHKHPPHHHHIGD